MRRKTLSMLLAVSMVVALGGCAGGSSSTSGSSASDVSASSSSVADASSASSASAEDHSGADTASADVLTHEEYMAADLDSEVTIETYVQAKQSWWEDEGQGKATVYGQSEDGAYFMYDMACSQEDYEKLVPGTKIQVTGYKSEWSGEVEIMDGTFEIVDGDEFIATPLDVTEMLGTDELIDHQNELVQFKGLTVEPANPAATLPLLSYTTTTDPEAKETIFTLTLPTTDRPIPSSSSLICATAPQRFTQR